MMVPDERSRARWAKLRGLVEAALSIPEPTRAEYLDRACGADVALRKEIEAQVNACERAAQSASFLAEPAAAFAAALFADADAITAGTHLTDAAGLSAKREALRVQMEAALRTALSDRYELERELGRGGTSTVYLGRDLRHDRSVAVKVLEPVLGAALSTERFLREIRVTAGLMHPHILPLHDSGEAAGLLYYVMPYVDGQTVRERLALEGRLTPDAVLRLVREVASALSYAHRRGVVHRDIKPANILLAEGHAVVADFGIARAVHKARELPPPTADHDVVSPSEDSGSDTLTQEGTSPGTPAYMAPEQGRAGAVVDYRADLYALGVVAYEALAGDHPFGARSVRSLIAAHGSETPADLAARCPDAPPAFAALVMRLLAKDPAERPQSADEVLRILDGSPDARTGTASRRRGVVLGGVGALLVIAGGVGIAAWRRSAASGIGRDAAEPRVVMDTVPRSTPTIHTVAVLPFVNIGGSTADDYISDGLTDELAQALGRLPGLRVAGRTSSYSLQGKTVTAQEVGRLLGVGSYVTGTTRRVGDRLRVTSQLVNTADGTVLWDSVYESSAVNRFTVQDELTRAVVGALVPALGARSSQASALDVGRGTADQEAYDLYLKGRYYWEQRGPINVSRAIVYLRQAVARDPGFARAHAGLAMAYTVLPNFVPDASDSATALIVASAGHALALDSTLADAQLALGAVLEGRLQFRDALARYRAAVAADPSSVTAHHWLGMSLLNLGRTDEALAELRHATELDPLSITPASATALALVFARRFPEARVAARRALALDSTFVFAIWPLGLAQIFGGQPDSGARTFERGARLHPDDSRMTAGLLLAEAAAGRWTAAERLRAQLVRPNGDRSGWADAAVAALVFGDREPLVHVLGTPTGQRRYVGAGALFGCNPILDPLWADARFRAAMRGLSVEACSLARPWPIRGARNAAQGTSDHRAHAPFVREKTLPSTTAAFRFNPASLARFIGERRNFSLNSSCVIATSSRASARASFPAIASRAANGLPSGSARANFSFHGQTSWQMSQP
jgi:TolB-like protein/Flp pilus assembly protein TadD